MPDSTTITAAPAALAAPQGGAQADTARPHAHAPALRTTQSEARAERPDTALTLDIDSSLERALTMPRLCGVVDSADVAAARAQATAEVRAARDAQPRMVELGQNSGLLAVISAVAVLMLLSYSKFRRLFSLLTQNLWSLRKRANAFDDRTSNEMWVFVLMAVQWSLYTGILLYILVAGDKPLPAAEAFGRCMAVFGVMGAYYALQFGLYAAMGYTFATPRGMRQLLGGFTASQSLLGFALMPVALVAMFFPESSAGMLWAGGALYAAARIVFNIKGFRIFYYKISSLLYYFLYLCAVEIVPPIAIYLIARAVANG